MPAHDHGTTRMPDAALQQGQVARLLMQHRATLYGYIFACVRNHADAEDILQNVCVAVTESIDRLTSEDGFLPWAREIARRRILAHRRTRAASSRATPTWCAAWPRRPTASRRGGRRRCSSRRSWRAWRSCPPPAAASSCCATTAAWRGPISSRDCSAAACRASTRRSSGSSRRCGSASSTGWPRRA